MSCENHSLWALSSCLILMGYSVGNLFKLELNGVSFFTPFFVITAIIFAYVSDVDTHKSKAKKVVDIAISLYMFMVVVPFSLIYIILLIKNGTGDKMFLIPIFSLVLLLLLLASLKHRRETHSIIITTCVFSLIAFLVKDLFMSNILVRSLLFGAYQGVVIHIFTDMCTEQGVALLYPISKKRYKIPLITIKSGKQEKFVTQMALNLSILISVGLGILGIVDMLG